MLFNISKTITSVFLLTLAWTSADSFGMDYRMSPSQDGISKGIYGEQLYLQHPFPPLQSFTQNSSISVENQGFFVYSLYPAYLDGDSTSNSYVPKRMGTPCDNAQKITATAIAEPTMASPNTQFHSCTFNFYQSPSEQQEAEPAKKKRGRGPGKKNSEKYKIDSSFRLNQTELTEKEIAHLNGEYTLEALLSICEKEYNVLSKDKASETSDQESDKYSDSDESVEEVLETRGKTQYSLRNVERVHWGTTTHEIPEVKSELSYADENSESEDEAQTKNKPKLIKKNKLKVPQKKAKKSSSGRKITPPTRLADMEMVGTQYR